MALPAIIRNLIPLGGYDIFAFYDQEGNQILTKASILKVSVSPDKNLPKHPLETGFSIIDHQVFQPTIIDCPIIVNDIDINTTYAELVNLFTSGTLINLQTKTGIISNLILKSIPSENSAEYFTANPFYLKFEQVIIIDNNSNFAPKKTSQKSNKNRGIILPENPTEENQNTSSSVLKSGIKWLRGG